MIRRMAEARTETPPGPLPAVRRRVLTRRETKPAGPRGGSRGTTANRAREAAGAAASRGADGDADRAGAGGAAAGPHAARDETGRAPGRQPRYYGEPGPGSGR
ncbi:hypothetical protein GCM10010236_00400 [Streptomyces eurythermus]|nr:hypothetical protein GCM10010236_00400 [Streptomyces eurythermus]